MLILKRKIFPFIIIITMGFTLLNSNAFGGSTLISLFLFCLLSGIIGLLIFSKQLFNIKKVNYETPHFVWLFVFLAVYVYMHGVWKNRIGLTHLYWVACSIFLFVVNFWANNCNKNYGKLILNKLVLFIHWGIVILSFFEAIVVLLQCTFIIPSPNKDFLCTGTWINPNVTAMYLALSLFSILQLSRNNIHQFTKLSLQIILTSTLIAIAMLQCRSAYIAAAIMLIAEYRTRVVQLIKSYLRFNIKGLLAIIIGFLSIQILISIFSYKSGSTTNRITIWKNTISLISENPLFGFGFGKFEKEYNLFISQEPKNSNDHINMPYNDFLELGVEGGLVAIAFWLLFLISLFNYAKRKKDKSHGLLPVVVSFIIIQITNFGIQAIPAMVLFLLYCSLIDVSFVENTITKNENHHLKKLTINSLSLKRGLTFVVFFICLIFTFNTFNLTSAFYNNWMFSKERQDEVLLKKYRNLNKTLNNYPIYHENFGDALMNLKHIPTAIKQYKMALENTSTPNVLSKTGFCYQVLKQYDSSEHYYTIVQNMQPYKFSPKLTLLKLYLQKGDTIMVRNKANEIKAMRIKVKSQRVHEIQSYADSILLILNNNSSK
jgi:O-antigen ligase